jgi:hypothetical protein
MPIKLSVFNGNTTYCIIIRVTRIESTKFITFPKKNKLNVKMPLRRLKPDSCKTNQHKTDRLTPDSRQMQNT